MAKEIDQKSSNILGFRPRIEFVEPEQEDFVPNPVAEAPTDQLKEFQDKKQLLWNLANSVEVLAAAVQARVDKKAKDVTVALDPIVDAPVIAALKREFPDIPFTTEDTPNGPTEKGFIITYDMYKHCRDKLRQRADEIALQGTTTEEDIEKARKGLPAYRGDFGRAEAKDGRLRPDLSDKATIIKPIDIQKFQNYLIRILINFLWKKFLRPPLAAFPPLDLILPEELASLPPAFKKQISEVKEKGVEVL